MSVLAIILGIMMAIGGVVCLLTPIATTLSIMYFFMILLFVEGIVFLVQSIAYKNYVDLVFAILSLIVGGFIVFSPQLTFITEQILLFIAAGWLIVRGVIDFVNAFRVKKAGSISLFVLALIVSLLVIGAGIYSFIHPLIFAGLLGILASCYFIVEGIDLIIAGCIGKEIKRFVMSSNKTNDED